MQLLSPAKLNLYFKVVGKREDGYHDIASLFQAVSMYDFISLERTSGDRFECNDPTLVSSNLVLDALKLFRQKTHLNEAVSIYLEKHIPKEAGLGGGSSNAATTLWGLNKLFGFPLKEKDLLGIAAKLGSDVPFFFSSGRAFCTGRGEVVTSLPAKKEHFWIAAPSFGLSTALVYQNFHIEEVKEDENDLERSAFFLEPRMRVIKEGLLSLGFEKVVMTGSGSSFFCVGEVQNPVLEGIRFYFVEGISRKDWY